jgi:hypothetical protein
MSSKRSNGAAPTWIRELCPRGGRRSHDRADELVRQARNGEPGAWSQLVREFEGMLRAVVRLPARWLTSSPPSRATASPRPLTEGS